MTTSPTRRIWKQLVSLVAIGGASVLLLAGLSSPAWAVPTCKGQPADIVGTAGDDLLEGGDGDDVIVGLGGRDSIYGHSGEDILCGGADGDWVFGGMHDDYIAGNGGDDRLYGDPKIGYQNGDPYYGNGFNDSFVGGDHSDFGGDWVYYTVSNYWLNQMGQGVTANLEGGTATGDGQDRLRGIENLSGSKGDDTLIGDDRPNYLIGGAGIDTIWGRDDNDAINGQAGSDNLFGGGGVWDWLLYFGADDPVEADLEARSATVGSDVDELSGFELVVGSKFDDELFGDPRMNYLAGRGGDDYLDGRDGHDMASFYTPVRANLRTGIARGRKAHTGPNGEGTDELVNLEGLWGSGKRTRDILIGDGGPNFLRGYSGNDSLRGRAGNDYFLVESGTEDVDGGSGDYDVLDYYFWTGGVTVNLKSSSTAYGGSLDGVESVLGTRYADTLRGNEKSNFLFGQGGDDTLIGRRGRDALAGGSGSNALYGGRASDRCAEAVSKTSCEETTLPPSHPLFVVGDVVARAERRYK